MLLCTDVQRMCMCAHERETKRDRWTEKEGGRERENNWILSDSRFFVEVRLKHISE